MGVGKHSNGGGCCAVGLLKSLSQENAMLVSELQTPKERTAGEGRGSPLTAYE